MPNGACLPCDVVIVSINGGRLSKALKSVRKAPKLNLMKSNRSAGILAYGKGRQGLEVLLVHPGGPFWRNKDQGAWSIPKGEIGSDEDPKKAALREFTEELGPSASVGPLRALAEVRQRGGKLVIAFSGEGSFDPEALVSNTFEIEWPPRSGRHQSFPEVDRAEWFGVEAARTKVLAAQIELIDRLEAAERWGMADQ
jgi:predicted NUDIX family NTP pyrophosphohydrolase